MGIQAKILPFLVALKSIRMVEVSCNGVSY